LCTLILHAGAVVTSPTLISLRPSCRATLSEVAMSWVVLDVLVHVIKPLCLTEMETRTGPRGVTNTTLPCLMGQSPATDSRDWRSRPTRLLTLTENCILRVACAQSTCGTWTTASPVSFSSRRPATRRRSRDAGTQSTWWRSRKGTGSKRPLQADVDGDAVAPDDQADSGTINSGSPLAGRERPRRLRRQPPTLPTSGEWWR
ncbi:hypothetical protein GBAR_LOCUS93, partial [Geodia barretti]